MLKKVEDVVAQLKKKGYRYYEERGFNATSIEKAPEWIEMLETGEGYHIEEYPKKKKADIYIMKDGEIQDYLFTVRKQVG